jgi:hypothetical protein
MFLVLLDSIDSIAQPPYPCQPFIFCPGGCQLDGTTCWDIDDPVPLDNGLIVLVAAGMIIGVYKLRSLRPI